jgi:uncharacterized protein (DUF2252 family)
MTGPAADSAEGAAAGSPAAGSAAAAAAPGDNVILALSRTPFYNSIWESLSRAVSPGVRPKSRSPTHETPVTNCRKNSMARGFDGLASDVQLSLIERSRTFAQRPSRAALVARGEAMRKQIPRSSHATWSPPRDRPDPLRLVEQANDGRISELIPLRHGRMLASPFTFYRGTALNMAVDLAGTPTTGFRVQACGDAHLGNFRCFATPERRVIFDIHDLDETLPAPWEWDLKRLATSFVLACRDNGFSDNCAREAVLRCTRSYREAMARFSRMRAVDVWYARFEAETLVEDIDDVGIRAWSRKNLTKAKNVCIVEDVFPKLADTSGEEPKIKDNPPLIYHHLERGEDEFYARIEEVFTHYRESLPDHRRVLLDRYAIKDKAIKVVGVGSVGTVCSVALLMAGEKDPLFLQIKEARPSVLEAYAGQSAYRNHGQRVVKGHRLMQSASDIFLGWTQDNTGRHFYVRQLRDMKLKFPIEKFKPAKMVVFADWCGGTLARAHARSGEAALISGYLGKADTFDRAIAAFALAYADQVERDHQSFAAAVRDGRIEARSDDGL